MVVIETQPLTHAARLNHKGARRVGEVDGLADGRRAALFILVQMITRSFSHDFQLVRRRTSIIVQQ